MQRLLLIIQQMKLVVSEALEQIDLAADQMAKRYISDRLPPVLHEDEVRTTNFNCNFLQL
jgi:hypothetical protein